MIYELSYYHIFVDLSTAANGSIAREVVAIMFWARPMSLCSIFEQSPNLRFAWPRSDTLYGDDTLCGQGTQCR